MLLSKVSSMFDFFEMMLKRENLFYGRQKLGSLLQNVSATVLLPKVLQLHVYSRQEVFIF